MEDDTMGCSYYQDKGGMFSFHPYCHKKGDYVNEDMYERYCGGFSYSDCPIYKGGSSGGCYLTSACVLAKGLPDDCHELTTLRAFRDGWLEAQPCGGCDIAEYYQTAPKIVSRINERTDKAAIYERIYTELVQPCVSWIENKQPEQAYRHYKAVTRKLQELYLTEE